MDVPVHVVQEHFKTECPRSFGIPLGISERLGISTKILLQNAPNYLKVLFKTHRTKSESR